MRLLPIKIRWEKEAEEASKKDIVASNDSDDNPDNIRFDTDINSRNEYNNGPEAITMK